MQTSDIFGHWCGLNMHTLRPGQDCITLWDYLRGLKSSWEGPQIGGKTAEIAMPLQAKWFKVHHLENGMVCFLHENYVRNTVKLEVIT